jgi:hypothetical protein
MFSVKVVSLLLGIVLVSSTISGCRKIVDSFPPRYVLNLRFTGHGGKDLLVDVQEDIIRKNITFSSIDGAILSPSVEIFESNGNKYLRINLSSLPNVNLKQISYTINNKHLIGNAEEKGITTKWHLVKNNPVVKLLKFDGRSIDQKNEPLIHYELASSD